MLQIVNSNLSHREAFRLYDSLPEDRIEELLDDSERLGDVLTIDTREVANQLPDEDFLSGPLKMLLELKKNLRGDNRKRLEDIIGKLDELQMEVYRASEYALDELSKIDNILNNA